MKGALVVGLFALGFMVRRSFADGDFVGDEARCFYKLPNEDPGYLFSARD